MNFDLDAVRRATLTHGYERAMRPALFRIGGGDAEAAHHATLQAMAQFGSLPAAGLIADVVGAALGAPDDAVTIAGIRFPGRVGLAAGVDKDGVAVTSWGALGFGHVEVGTVTAEAQPGNPQPRLFRLKASHGLINRMGFNNDGSQALAATLCRARSSGNLSIPVGVSLGKTKTTPVEEATRDYLTSLGRLSGLADYFAVNVSSPNTPGLRTLQDKAPLLELLQSITARERNLAAERGAHPTPVFVKIAPDLTEDALEDVLEVAHGSGVSGLIATNTTLARDGLARADLTLASEAGGLSGAPLTRRAREVVGFLASRTQLPIIGVGGIMSADDGLALMDSGADLLQVYSGFIYKGPGLVRDLNEALRTRARRG
ncbi:quinone-dependent dihydroorotate dehydrogenase [Dermacoccus barathri]|uniref:quinone-dependent dihydroorotate dehydrogenase n=1 Tax=Dermacoccus barathri TaxID=322601 RepID=UPI00187A5FCA|nr:quinone-dependent dihydroorotate dehydrogenase [Dermacoccus barathri]MBE7370853.1 quinone-dependent dihydroorotate dehydrogenase [Dermacoccus barathri]